MRSSNFVSALFLFVILPTISHSETGLLPPPGTTSPNTLQNLEELIELSKPYWLPTYMSAAGLSGIGVPVAVGGSVLTACGIWMMYNRIPKEKCPYVGATAAEQKLWTEAIHNSHPTNGFDFFSTVPREPWREFEFRRQRTFFETSIAPICQELGIEDCNFEDWLHGIDDKGCLAADIIMRLSHRYVDNHDNLANSVQALADSAKTPREIEIAERLQVYNSQWFRASASHNYVLGEEANWEHAGAIRIAMKSNAESVFGWLNGMEFRGYRNFLKQMIQDLRAPADVSPQFHQELKEAFGFLEALSSDARKMKDILRSAYELRGPNY